MGDVNCNGRFDFHPNCTCFGLHSLRKMPKEARIHRQRLSSAGLRDTATCWQTLRRPLDFLYWATLLPPSCVTTCTKYLQKHRPISWWEVTLNFTKNYVCYLVQIWKLLFTVLEMWHRLLIKLLLKCYFHVFCFYFCTFIVFSINEP